MAHIETATKSDKLNLKEALNAHQRLAKEGYSAFHNDKKLSVTTWSHVIELLIQLLVT